jgi:DNA-binding XRE family transcriptional regulator
MKSSVQDVMPLKMRRAMIRFGADLAMARRKRRLTAAMMAERVGVSKSTYARIEKGDPAVAMGAYAMALFVMGFGEALGDLVDARNDEHGLLLDEERLPQRVRIKKSPTSL